MNKEKKDIVPELRFPEFEKKNSWKDVKLIDVTDKNKKWSFTGGPFGSNLKSSDYVKEDEGIRIIQLQNIGDGKFKNNYKIFTSKEKADELLSCNIYPGDIIMSKMGDPVGRACLIPDYHDRYVMGSDGIRIVVNEDKYDKYFIYLVINSKIFRSKIENSSTGSTRKRIGLLDLKKLTLTVPKDKGEQQKIANCLFSLDNIIKAETDKLDHLKDHKKGLLQQLFPVNGETKPQFRFTEFENDGDWIEKELSIALDGKSSQIAKNKLSFIEKGYPVFGADGMLGFIDSYAQEDDYIAIVKDGSGVGNLFFYKGQSSLLGTLNYLFSKDDKKYILKWLYYLLQTISFKPFIKGSGIPHIYYKDYSKLIVLIPKNPKEQQKIANCLSKADDLIEAQKIKIKTLKKHKKGLMQQLFPYLNELVE